MFSRLALAAAPAMAGSLKSAGQHHAPHAVAVAAVLASSPWMAATRFFTVDSKSNQQIGSIVQPQDVVVSAHADTPILDALAALSDAPDQALTLVDDDGIVVGMFCESDYVFKLADVRAEMDPEDAPASMFVSSPVLMAGPDATLYDSLARMAELRLRYLPTVSAEFAASLTKDTVEAGIPLEACTGFLSVRSLLKKHLKTATFAEVVPEAGVPNRAMPVGKLLSHLSVEYDRKLLLNTRIEDKLTVDEAVNAMTKYGVGSVAVVDKDGAVLAVFTSRDYVRKVLANKLPGETPLIDVATHHKVVTAPTGKATMDCAQRMLNNKVRRLPVVDAKSNVCMGVASLLDLTHAICPNVNKPVVVKNDVYEVIIGPDPAIAEAAAKAAADAAAAADSTKNTEDS